jgi:hypothetical protein
MNIIEAKEAYSKLEYPGSKSDRVSFIKKVLKIDISDASERRVIAGLISDFLSDQSVLYDYLDSSEEELVFAWVENNWESEYVYVYLLMSIVCQLESVKSKKFLLKARANESNSEVKNLIDSILSEEYS